MIFYSNDACAPHPFKIPMKIVERAMNNCYLGDGTVHPGDHFLFIHELCVSWFRQQICHRGRDMAVCGRG
jgi:hypothetical protein